MGALQTKSDITHYHAESGPLTKQDIEELHASGRDPADILEQIRHLLSSPPKLSVDRACTVGDGIRRVAPEEKAELLDHAKRIVDTGRLSDFIPASGAATRMFSELVSALKNFPHLLAAPHLVHEKAAQPTVEGKTASALLQFFQNLDRFAFHGELRAAVRELTGGALDIAQQKGEELLLAGHGRTIISALLYEPGLNYTGKPKALLAFHRYEDESVRTALEEHLVTAALSSACEKGICRIHITRSPEHREGFDRLLKRLRSKIEDRYGVRFDVSFSEQCPTTDTVALDGQGRLVRTADQKLLFRAGGHGSLLKNLNAHGDDVVYINNIDNVHPDRSKPAFIESKLLLVGVLGRAQALVRDILTALEDGALDDRDLERARALVHAEFGEILPDAHWQAAGREEKEALLRYALHRPIRVAGMVKNTGEPGGGPFWVRDISGMATLQIMERSEIDTKNPEQAAIADSATHFNPVRIVCGLRDHRGERFDLDYYADKSGVFVVSKSHEGAPIVALERPGLWNRSMYRWLTIFVEIGIETFAPVKTVQDLARDAHQA